LGAGVRVHGAGRTDAGVHALAQVASIHLPAGRAAGNLEALRRDLNDLLPFDVNLLALAPAPPTFHARHDALLRVYRYRLSRRRTAFGKPYVFWVKDRLDAEAMSRAAAALVGRHDFGSFCENPEGHDSTLVEVSFARLAEARGEPDLLVFRIGASHFLWKMVRRVVGALVEVGTGRLPPDAIAALLSSRSTAPAAWTAPPSGLFLEAVLYPGDPAPEVDDLRPAY
ncbi:tRNA pseudouridine(38-40) synthase TruA, partial [Acidobacteria bacterium ACD]|nr:tRNA pseudouridine(38-40) synthase TruA [Acidobacteria bacterium ACD]